MSLARRGRSLAVSGFLLSGAIGIISSTQTWVSVQRLDEGADILVPGASALPLLAPLSLAVLALGAALSITGRVMRIVFGVLAAATSVLLAWSTVLVLVDPLTAIASTVAETTGLAGHGALDALVGTTAPSAWPYLALVGWAVLLVSAALVLTTGHAWKAGGRRYKTDADATSRPAGPVDAVDSWDELSRGTDPTR